jgi:hypothetical protein
MNDEIKYLDQNTMVSPQSDNDNSQSSPDNSTQNKEAPEITVKSSEEERKKAIRENNTQRLREKMEAAEKRAKELEEMLLQKKQQEEHDHEEEYTSEQEEITIGDEELVSGKDIKKYVKSITTKYDQQLNSLREQSRADAAASRLKGQYSDFDEVVSRENIKMLKTLYPEEHYLITSNPDIYAKGKAAYNMIKNFGIAQAHEEQVNPDIDRRLQENKVKPRSAASAAGKTGDTPLSRVEDYDRRILTEERKEQLRAQIAHAKKFSTK